MTEPTNSPWVRGRVGGRARVGVMVMVMDDELA